ncbi:MAG: enoyl-CoA hydratase-related protein, partial [Terriglobales bacterium]
MSFQRIKLVFSEEDRVARIVLNAPKPNIIDRAMMAELDEALADCEQRRLHAILVAAEGPHFSFGASVQEHLPKEIATTLDALHG